MGIPALLPVLFGSQNLYAPSVLFNANVVYFHGLRNADQRDPT